MKKETKNEKKYMKNEYFTKKEVKENERTKLFR